MWVKLGFKRGFKLGQSVGSRGVQERGNVKFFFAPGKSTFERRKERFPVEFVVGRNVYSVALVEKNPMI